MEKEESPQLKWLHFKNTFWICQGIFSSLICIDPFVSSYSQSWPIFRKQEGSDQYKKTESIEELNS